MVNQVPAFLAGVDHSKRPALTSLTESKDQKSVAVKRGKKAGPKVVVRKYELKADHAELREIRTSLGMTKAAFAGALQMKQCTLDSYEYGKTRGVPVVIMDKARELAVRHKKELDFTNKHFNGKSMSDILDGWAKELKMPADNAVALSKVLQTTPTTIRRWKSNLVRPSIGQLIEISRMVSEGPKGYEKFAAQVAIRKLKAKSGGSIGRAFIPVEEAGKTIEQLHVTAKVAKDIKVPKNFTGLVDDLARFLKPVDVFETNGIQFFSVSEADFKAKINALMEALSVD